MRKLTWIAGLTVVMSLAGRGFADDASGVSPDGFIQKWLVLAPIPLAEGSRGADALDKQLMTDDAAIKPKAGDKVTIDGKEYVWKETVLTEHIMNLLTVVGGDADNNAAYLVSYIDSPDEKKNLSLKVGSDDESKVYLNGKEVLKITNEQTVGEDQSSAEVTLQKGVNVIVAKVINVGGDWGFCARFMAGAVTDIKAKTAD
jgi:hypothetical protein